MKAILVIDKPSSCIECRYSLLGGCYCTLTQEDLIVNDGDISENCPLKPIPNEACQILVDGLDAMEKMKSVEVRVVRRKE